MRIKRTNVYSKKLPKEFDEFKIVFVSDLHNRSKKARRIERMVKKINNETPDIVIIGGDFSDAKPQYTDVVFQKLEHIKAPTYAVLGNHDYYNYDISVTENFKQHGIISIINKSIWLFRGESKIKLGGFDDWWFGYPYPESFFHDLTDKEFSVLVSHNPDIFELIDMENVSLALAGHHHGGQCSAFGKWAPMIASDYGLKHCGTILRYVNTTIINSMGIGTSHIPVRFCAIPEINSITLHTEDK